MCIMAIDIGLSKSIFGFSESFHDVITYGSMPTKYVHFKEEIEKVKPTKIIIEICGVAGWIYDLCTELRIPCDVCNVADERWKWHNTRAKTDRKDVDRMLYLAHSNATPKVHMPSKEIRDNRSLMKFRKKIVYVASKSKNRIRARFAENNINFPRGISAWSKTHIQSIKEVVSNSDEIWAIMVLADIALLENALAQIATIDRKLNMPQKGNAMCKKLQTIYGIGPRTAELFLAVIDDPNRFSSGRKLGCYLGLTQRIYQSGQMTRSGKISHMGDVLLRNYLVEAAWLAIRKSGPARDIFERVCKGMQSRRKIAIVAVARHLAIWCWAMWRDNADWNPLVNQKALTAS